MQASMETRRSHHFWTRIGRRRGTTEKRERGKRVKREEKKREWEKRIRGKRENNTRE